MPSGDERPGHHRYQRCLARSAYAQVADADHRLVQTAGLEPAAAISEAAEFDRPLKDRRQDV